MGRAFPYALAPVASGIASVDTFSDLAGLDAAVGTQVYVEDEGGTRTLCAVGAFSLWLRDAWVRKTDGTLYTCTPATDTEGTPNDLHLYAGMSAVPAAWPIIGTASVTANYVELNGVVYPDSASTAERCYLYLELYAAPPHGHAAEGFCGIMAGSNRGGTTRSLGVKFTGTSSPYGLALGIFGNSIAEGGSSSSVLGCPVEALIDLSAAGALSQGMGDAREPGLVVRRQTITTTQRFFEVGALDAGASAVNGFRLIRAIQIDLT